MESLEATGEPVGGKPQCRQLNPRTTHVPADSNSSLLILKFRVDPCNPWASGPRVFSPRSWGSLGATSKPRG